MKNKITVVVITSILAFLFWNTSNKNTLGLSNFDTNNSFVYGESKNSQFKEHLTFFSDITKKQQTKQYYSPNKTSQITNIKSGSSPINVNFSTTPIRRIYHSEGHDNTFENRLVDGFIFSNILDKSERSYAYNNTTLSMNMNFLALATNYQENNNTTQQIKSYGFVAMQDKKSPVNYLSTENTSATNETGDPGKGHIDFPPALNIPSGLISMLFLSLNYFLGKLFFKRTKL